MAQLERDAFLSRIKEYIGEAYDDKSISFLEDMTDTFDSLSQLSQEGATWKTKYEQNDADWRKKYIDRFNSPAGNDNDNNNDNDDGGGEIKILTFADLFKEGGK